MKTEEEILSAVEALKAWFISQELAPSEGAQCLITLIGQQLVANATDVESLNMAIGLFHNQLVMEIAKQLENRDQA